jgi:hypothetical protein
LDYV